MKSNNDALKKHHFWILAGLAPLLVFLAVIFLLTGVSGAIEKKVKEVQDNEKSVASANAPGSGLLKDLDSKKGILGFAAGAQACGENGAKNGKPEISKPANPKPAV